MSESMAKKEEEKARETRLRQAIANDDIAEVHNLIREEQELLDRVSKRPFQDTPLHLAAEAGKTHVAMEIAILKPSFTRGLNPEGYSPMHLALQHEHYQTVRALMTLDPGLIRVRGRGGITPLHFLAGEKRDNEKENVELLELLAEFLIACKSSIEDLTSRCETTVHFALKNHNLKAFKVLFGWLRRVKLAEILNWKDQDGNTVLHIAALEGQPEVIKLLIGYTFVNVDAKNFRGETAREIFKVNPSGDQCLAMRLRMAGRLTLRPKLSLSQFLCMEPYGFGEIISFFFSHDETTRSIIMGLATIFATATYQAALTPPGGYWGDNSSNPPANSTVIAVDKPHQAGNIILNGSNLYKFTALNSLVFLASLTTIWITAVPLWPRTLPVYVLASLAGLSFSATAMIEYPESDKATATFINTLYLILLVAGIGLPMAVYAAYFPFVGGIDATRRRVGKLLS